MKKTINISQSLIKDMHKYLNENYCGNLMKYKHVDKKFLPSTGVLKLGHYFEYVATGQLPKDGQIPIPEYLKSKKREWTREEIITWVATGKFPGTVKTPPLGVDISEEGKELIMEHVEHDITEQLDMTKIIEAHQKEVNIQSLTSEYRRAHAQAMNFKRLCKDMGIKIISTGERATRNGLIGDRDIEAWYNGKKITIDLKYSGLLRDEWSPMGWGGLIKIAENGVWEMASISRWQEAQLEHHKIQALQYHYIFKRPFYYWVFSSSQGADETGENAFIHMDIQSKNETDSHLRRAKEMGKAFSREANFGFEARPHYNICSQCDLFSICEDASRVQEPITIKL